MHCLIVRHGQSKNNALATGLAARIDGGEINRNDKDALWLEGRFDDPPVTALGQQQSDALARYFREFNGEDEALEVARKHGVKLYCSPMRRTCQTVAPLMTALNESCTVLPHIYEVGGVYTTFKDKNGVRKRVGPGKSLSNDDIKKIHRKFDTEYLPSSGGWYSGKWEMNPEGRMRAARVAKWLKSPELAKEVGNRLLVLVSHSHFMDMLLKQLMGITDDSSRDSTSRNNHDYNSAIFTNPTGTCLLRIENNTTIMRWHNRTFHYQYINHSKL
eukprot:m.342941 g.342941  ORF g.342941 m.342941 type:complete len:273 (-) comp22064_c0_seq1:20-838(-)